MGQQNRAPKIGYIPVDSVQGLTLKQKQKVARFILNPMYCQVNFVDLGDMVPDGLNQGITIPKPIYQSDCYGVYGPEISSDPSGGVGIDTTGRNPKCINYDIPHDSDTSIIYRTNYIPDTIGVNYILEEIEFIDSENYHYYATVDTCSNVNDHGYLFFRKQNGKQFGLFTYNNEYFRLVDLGDEVNVLVKMNKEDDCVLCGVGLNESNIDGFKDQAALSRSSASGCTVNIMANYTTAAEENGEPIQWAILAVDVLNQAMKNSELNLGYRYVGSMKLDAIEGDKLWEEFVEDVLVSQEHMDLRDSVGADLTLLYTRGAFFVNQGNTFIQSAGFAGRGSIAQIDIDAPYEFIECHEIAHLHGCLHYNGDPDQDITIGGNNGRIQFRESSRANVINIWFDGKPPYRTIVNEEGADGGEFILHYSNKDVWWRQLKRTGKKSRHNAGALGENHCLLSEFREDPPRITLDITGPSSISNGDVNTWCIELDNCLNLVSLTCEISTDGVNFELVNLNDLCFTRETPFDQDIIIKVKVKCTDGDGNPTHIIHFMHVTNTDVEIICPKPDGQEFSGGANSEEDQVSIHSNFEFKVITNPTSKELNIQLLEKPVFTNYKLKIVNEFGRQLLMKEISNGTLSFSLPVEYLEKGLYYISIYNSDSMTTKKFVKL